MLDLSIVIPTFNERANIVELLARLEKLLCNISWEIVFVDDDSPDETAELVREIARSTPHVRCLQRIGRRGLSRAVVEGILATSAPCIAVMDADLQHDESILPAMLERLSSSDLDIVVGSRYCSGGSTGDWGDKRAAMSRLATRVSRLIVTAELTDPMSGFFMLKRQAFMAAVRNLSGEGYKILLDIFASSPTKLRFAEIPYTFRIRVAGESKLDSAVVWEYLLLIADKLFGHIIPVRFVLFSAVGASGVIVHFIILGLAHRIAGLEFSIAQGMATLFAMTSNYALNNTLTYRDRRRKGKDYWTGLVSFYLACGIGAIANVGIASIVFTKHHGWWLAGLAGILVSTVWNYSVTKIFTWNAKSRK